MYTFTPDLFKTSSIIDEQVMKEFRDYVKNNPLYESTFYDDIGDGIVVIKIKK